MKNVKNQPTTKPKSLLVQLRLVSKTNAEFSPYDAYEELVRVLKNSNLMDVYQAEFRVNDEEKTSI